MNIIEASKEVYERRATGIKLPGMLGHFIAQGNLRDCTYTWNLSGRNGEIERAWFSPESLISTNWEIVNAEWKYSKSSVNIIDYEAFKEMAQKYFNGEIEKTMDAYLFYKGATTQGNITETDIKECCGLMVDTKMIRN